VGTDEIQRLIEDLSDPDEDVGLYAIDRLTRLGAPAVEPLLAVVVNLRPGENNPSILSVHKSWPEAVLVLGQIGDPRAVEPLLAVFHDLSASGWPNGWGRRAILVKTLGRIGDPRALTVLEDVAANDPVESLRADVGKLLEKLRSAR
jgi:HEAT repeat protein